MGSLRFITRRYTRPFACFRCRKVFKKPPVDGNAEVLRHHGRRDEAQICPECRGPMAYMGHDFKAPRRNDLEQWEKVKRLVEAGIVFEPCTCCGETHYGEAPPKALREVDAFLVRAKAPFQSEGVRLLERVEEKRRPGGRAPRPKATPKRGGR